MSNKLKKDDEFNYNEFEVVGDIRQGINQGLRIDFSHITQNHPEFDFIVENNVGGKIHQRQQAGWQLWKDDSYGINEVSAELNARIPNSGVACVHVGECGAGGSGMGYLMYLPNRNHPAYMKGSTVSRSIAADGGHINDIEHSEARKSALSMENRTAAGMGSPASFKENKATGFDGLSVADVVFEEKVEVRSPLKQQAEGLINAPAGINQISST